jgi:hypothetical protein
MRWKVVGSLSLIGLASGLALGSATWVAGKVADRRRQGTGGG